MIYLNNIILLSTKKMGYYVTKRQGGNLNILMDRSQNEIRKGHTLQAHDSTLLEKEKTVETIKRHLPGFRGRGENV